MTKPRILIVENSTAITGALISIIRSSTLLADRFEFIFMLPTSSTVKATVEDAGFRCQTLPMRELSRNLFSILIYVPVLIYNAFAFARLVKNIGANLIVVNDYYNLVPAVYKLFLGNVPYITYVRFLPSKFPQPVASFWWWWHREYAVSIVAVSQAVSKQLPLNKKIAVIGNELPIQEVDFEKPQAKIILYLANFIPGKGQEYALKSWSGIAEKFPEWKLRFVGGDMGIEKNARFKKSLMRLASDLKVDRQTEWLDFEHDLPAAYRDAGFVLNFSASESFSLTCLEAMFYGRTVIATRCGGPEEIIENGVDGLLVPVADVMAMKQAIEYALINVSDRERMSEAAFKNVRIKFNRANTVEKLGGLYTRVLGG